MPTFDPFSLLLGAVVAFVATALAAFGLARRQSEARIAEGRAQREAEVARLLAERDGAQARVAQLEARHDEDARRLAEAQAQRADLERASGGSEARVRELGDRLAEKAAALERATGELAQLRAELGDARLREEKLAALRQATEQLLQRQEQFVTNAREELSAKFGEVAGALFDQKSQVFASQSQQQLTSVLQPFAEELKGFREKAETLYTDEAKERAGLKGALDQLMGLNRDWSEQAKALTNAMQGNVKHRGNWGEMILEKALEASGLVEGEHYTRQGSEKDEEGNRLIPDIVVKLPDSRRVIVDSKVSLARWQEAMNAEDDESRAVALKAHVGALKRHVRDIKQKDYASLFDGKALDLVLVFVPIEGALSAAFSEDPELSADALSNRVVLVSPNTLVSVLRAIEYGWARAKSLKHANDIIGRAESLAKSLERFLVAFGAVGEKLRAAQNAFEAANDKFRSTHGPLSQVQRLQSLGVKAAKRLGAPDPAAGDEPVAGDDFLLERQPLE